MFPTTFLLLQKLLNILAFPLTSSEQFLSTIWNTVSQAAVLILPQIKPDLQLSHCAIFFQ